MLLFILTSVQRLNFYTNLFEAKTIAMYFILYDFWEKTTTNTISLQAN